MNHKAKIAVSVIIPVYNAESTVAGTLDSMVAQTLRPIEIICIDDGSTDSTLDILKQYQEDNPDVIQIITGPNSGSFNARSKGIKAASGEYIAFCDADDTTDPRMLSALYATATCNKADIAVCSFCRVNDGNQSRKEMNWGETSKTITPFSGWIPLINTSCWNKLIKANLAKQHIKLSHRPKITEDALFLLSIYPKATSIAFTDLPLYFYREDGETAMSSLSDQSINEIVESWLELRDEISSEHPDYLEILDMAAFIHLAVSLPLIVSKTRPDDLSRIINEIICKLDSSFPLYKSGRFLSARNALAKPSYYLLPYVALLAHRLKLFSPALAVYNRLTEKLGHNIKW